VPAAVQVPQYAPAEADIFLKRAINSGNAISVRVNQNVPLHAGENLLNP